jgi:cellulose synthase/poly-beta-1,6-N-acetylglucosamine synthase-like glycosyltransferase
MQDFIYILEEIFVYLFIIYSGTLIISYVVLSLLSSIETITYFKKNSFINYKDIMTSSHSPSISIIAPAYNESLNIVENVRSLLSNHYVNYDVIIVNDGSSDNSLELLIEAYELVKVKFLINEQVSTKPLREGVFKSINPAFKKLIVLDKENGGKSDALNCGLNISTSKYVACVDVDCLLIEDALQKMVKPFLEVTDKKVIATGGVIRIANSCVINDGKLLEVNFPKNLIVSSQILEYLRSFSLGRMAWSRLNGLLVISGAFGLFDRKIAIEVGGYDVNTVGEDMEIIVRMRRHMEEKKIEYRVSFIPDPLCWTEAPEDYKILISQRNRWTRGTIETLKKHRKMALNWNYGKLGIISIPYWFLYERMAPILEVIGILYFMILIYIGRLRWDFALSFFLASYFFSILFSLLAIFTEELTYNEYKKKGVAFRMLLTLFLEPFILHTAILYAAIKGNIDYYFNKNKKWGVMVRKGLKNK